MNPTQPPDPMPDPESVTGELVYRAQTGDKKALAKLIRRYRIRVQDVVRRRLGPKLRGHLESGDVVQDVMLEILQSVQGFQPRSPRSFFRWICRLVESHLCNASRTAHRSPVKSSVPMLPMEEAVDESPPDLLVRETDRETVNRALDRLSPEHRRVIELRNYRGLSFKQIARDLGKSPDAAWMLHKRAKTELVKAVCSERSEK